MFKHSRAILLASATALCLFYTTAASAADKTDCTPSSLRLRGSATDLYIDRCETEFSSSSQATLDFSSDQIAGTRSTKANGAIGWDAFHGGRDGTLYDLVFYGAANWSVSRTSKAAGGTVDYTKTLDFGALGSFYVPGAPGGLINVRADYLLNDLDESKVANVNLQYVPYRNGYLNDFGNPGKDGIIWLEFIGDLRAKGSVFTDRGSNPAINKDTSFSGGGEVGFSLLGEGRFPMELTTTYLYLASFTGGQDIGYLKSGLTLNFDKSENWGVTFSYSNGRLEDTGAKERLWEVALTARY